MIKEHERLVLKVPVPGKGVTLEAAQVRPVGGREITHARELVA